MCLSGLVFAWDRGIGGWIDGEETERAREKERERMW